MITEDMSFRISYNNGEFELEIYIDLSDGTKIITEQFYHLDEVTNRLKQIEEEGLDDY